MGWDNEDVTTRQIATDVLAIPRPGTTIEARLYRPEAARPLPLVVYFHGGGFFGGTLETVENPCKALADKGNVAVLSVGYRLAPEHPFPTGLRIVMQRSIGQSNTLIDLGLIQVQSLSPVIVPVGT